MAVQISAGELNGTRHVVRTDQGNLYAFFVGSGGNNIDAWFGGTTGASWVEKDAGGGPASERDTISIAIDSDNRVHVVYVAGAASAEDLDYVLFHTVDSTQGDDTCDTPEEAISMEDADNKTYGCAVAVDSNDIPHAVVIGTDADMGQDYDTAYYDNRIEGTVRGIWGIQ